MKGLQVRAKCLDRLREGKENQLRVIEQAHNVIAKAGNRHLLFVKYLHCGNSHRPYLGLGTCHLVQ